MSAQVILTSLSKRFHFTPLSALSAAPRKKNDPKLIFLFSWMGAKIPHVQKYVNGYSKIWPSTPIILVQSLPHDFRPFSRYASEYGPLMSLVAQFDVDLTSKSDGKDVLMVTMSNGGCWSAQAFLSTLSVTATLKPRIVIHDSCPGLPRYSNTLNAFLIAGKYGLFSKAIATVVITIYYFLARAIDKVLRIDTVRDMRRLMIERIQPERRIYIYSKNDALIDYRDVEAHAADAREAGNEVELEHFDNSAHVMHLRTDEDRYWKIVQEAWNPKTEATHIYAPEPAQDQTKSELDGSYIEAKAIPSGTTSLYSSYSAPSLDRSPEKIPQADEVMSFNNQSTNTKEAEQELNSRSDEAESDNDAEEAELDPSILGTRSYWDKFYEREYGNYSETQDEGEIWFGEESEARIIRYLESTFPAPTSPTRSQTISRSNSLSRRAGPSILDLGTGNGHLLFAIHEAGFHQSTMKGIDYSSHSIALATNIAKTRKVSNISFEVVDFLHAGNGRATYDVVLDKGTFDAISLCSDVTDMGEKLWTLYAKSVAQYMTRDSKLIVTSCNWTKEELSARLTSDHVLAVHAYFKEPKKQFTFGGKSGSTTSQVVFRLA